MCQETRGDNAPVTPLTTAAETLTGCLLLAAWIGHNDIGVLILCLDCAVLLLFGESKPDLLISIQLQKHQTKRTDR